MISNSLRFALTKCYSIGSLLGLRPYEVYLVIVKSTGIRPGLGTRTRVDTRLYIDGYKNPPFYQVSSKDVFLSSGQLTDQDFKLILTYPYTYGSSTGGLDPSVFNPVMDGYNTQLYFKVIGPGLPSTGQYFKRKYSQEDNNLSYNIFLEATGEIPGS